MFGAALANQYMVQAFVNAGKQPPNIPMLVLDPQKSKDPHIDHSNASELLPRDPSPAQELRMPEFGAVSMGYATGQAGKSVVHSINSGMEWIQEKWDSWSGTLGELLGDFHWVWWGLVAVAGAAVLYEFTPVLGVLWDALGMMTQILRGALKILGWVWDGFTGLIEELWSTFLRLVGAR